MKRLNPIEFVKGLKRLVSGKTHIPESLEDNPVLQVLIGRRSVRSFTDQEIPDDVFQTVLEAGRVAPSGVNLQSWSFGVFDAEAWKETFGGPIPFGGKKAVIICGDMYRIHASFDEFPFKPLVEYSLSLVNAGMAAYAMNIAAEACGVASVMLSDTGKTGFFDAGYLKKKLNLPDGVYPVTTIIFGYPKRKPAGMPPKLPLEEIIFSKSYSTPDPEVFADWLKQMQAGYRATHITSSFAAQLKHYRKKLNRAEEDLHKAVFYRPEEDGESGKIIENGGSAASQ